MIRLELDDDMPKNARRLWQAAEQAGWDVYATRATGTPCDNQGQPQHRTERRPLVDSNTGTPLLTDAGKPRVEIITTDEPLLVDSVAIRLSKRDPDGEVTCLAAIWEDNAFRTALRQRPFGVLNAKQLTELVTS